MEQTQVPHVTVEGIPVPAYAESRISPNFDLRQVVQVKLQSDMPPIMATISGIHINRNGGHFYDLVLWLPGVAPEVASISHIHESFLTAR